jgi:serine/threonine-protein kinase
MTFAMKIANDPLDLQSEINALKALNGAGGVDSYFIEADDVAGPSEASSYYVMKYINGTHVIDFLEKQGVDWFDIVARRILERLGELHRKGFIFGDLKRDNILVYGHGYIELVDFGGVTRKGKAVRQFTEQYDRGYWNAGSRKADEGYDLFAFALLCMQCTDPVRELDSTLAVLPQYRSPEYLKEILKRCRMKEGSKVVLRNIIDGKLQSTDRALRDWREVVLNGGPASANSAAFPWLKSALIVSIVLFIASLVWTIQ